MNQSAISHRQSFHSKKSNNLQHEVATKQTTFYELSQPNLILDPNHSAGKNINLFKKQAYKNRQLNDKAQQVSATNP